MREPPVLYLDILLSVNLLVNYLLLLSSAKFLGASYRKGRLLLGAMLGAVFSLVILLPGLPYYLTALLKLPMAAAMVVVSYRFSSWRDFWKRLLCLCVSSFLFAGLLLAISYCLRPAGLVVRNGAVYLAVSPLLLLGGTVFCYFALSFLYRILGRRTLQRTTCTLTLKLGEKERVLLLKIDTGNQLTEPFSGLPVTVVEHDAVSDLLPENFPVSTSVSVRMIPYQTLSGEGLLPAFRAPECTIVYGSETIVTDAFYLAVSDQKLCNGCQGLLNPEVLSTGKASASREKTSNSEARP